MTLPRDDQAECIGMTYGKYCQRINFQRVSYVCFYINKILQNVFVILLLDNVTMNIKTVCLLSLR